MHRDTDHVLTIETGGRSFLIEREATTAPGWLLGELYRDGWPVMAGPFPTAESATAYIDTLRKQVRSATTRKNTATNLAGCS